MEHLKVGIILYDILDNGQDFTISYINPIIEKITELKKEDVIGNKITQISPELAELGFLKILRNVNDTGTSKKCDLTVYEKDELIHWSRNHFEKLSSGKILSIHYDITNLKKSDERYDKVFNNSNLGLAIFQNKHIIQANNAFSQLTGFPLDKIYNMSFIELNELFFNDDKYDLGHCVNDLTSGKEISKQREFSIKHEDGSKQCLHCYAVQINYHGKPAIQISFDDITERIKTREALKKSEKELIEIQGLSKVGSFQHDLLTEGITGTPEFFKITGFNPKFPLYLPSFYKIMPPEDLKEFKENVKKSFNKTTEFYFWIKTPNNQAKYLKTKTTPPLFRRW
ncbi:PAS fold protein [anaerobic digester metagenome]